MGGTIIIGRHILLEKIFILKFAGSREMAKTQITYVVQIAKYGRENKTIVNKIAWYKPITCS